MRGCGRGSGEPAGGYSGRPGTSWRRCQMKNEAQAAARLHHQHIVPVYEVSCERGVHSYAIRLFDEIMLSQGVEA
jgi:hypothetical protein